MLTGGWSGGVDAISALARWVAQFPFAATGTHVVLAACCAPTFCFLTAPLS